MSKTCSRVLMVDDDAGVRGMLAEALRGLGEGIEVQFASNGKEALEVLERGGIDLVVTDLMMPVMDGLELIAHMMEHHPAVRRIVVSSSEASAMRLYEAELGFDAFLVKPVNPTLLVERIRRALEARNESGFLKGISLPSFIQLIDLEQKTCTLRVRNAADQREAICYFQRGHMLNVDIGGTGGLAAAFEALGWSNVQISIHNECPAVADSIGMPLHSVLLEAACRRDRVQAGLAAVVDDNDPGPDFSNTTFFMPVQAREPEPVVPLPQPGALTGTLTAEAGRPVPPIVKPSALEQLVDFDTARVGRTPGQSPASGRDGSRPPQPQTTACATVSPAAPLASRVEAAERRFGELVEQGIEAFRRKDYPQARAVWEEARGLRPDDGKLLYNLKLVARKLEGNNPR